MILTEQDVLSSPVTEDAVVVFKNGLMVGIDDWRPVYDEDGNAIVNINCGVRITAVTNDGSVIYFDGDDVQSFELGPKDSDDILKDVFEYTGPNQEPVELDSDVDVTITLSQFLAKLFESGVAPVTIEDDGSSYMMYDEGGDAIDFPPIVKDIVRNWNLGDLSKYDSLEDAVERISGIKIRYQDVGIVMPDLFQDVPREIIQKSFLDAAASAHVEGNKDWTAPRF